MNKTYTPKYIQKKKEKPPEPRKCLRCSKQFKPKDRFNFICKNCAKSNETDDSYSVMK